MHILITGAAGMIGRKLTERLAKDGGLSGQPIDQMTLLDVVPPTVPAGFSGRIDAVASDLAAPGAKMVGCKAMGRLVRERLESNEPES